MVQILRHELKKQGNETVLFLYLDQSNTEFARELGSLDDNAKGDLDKSVNSYIRSKLPNLKQATVKIMVGGLLVTSFAFSPAVGGLFGDDDNRAHAAELDQSYKGFSDVSPNRESAPAIEALVKAGVITGYPDGFHPTEQISRQHAAVMFVRALDLPTDNVTDPGFKDVPTTHQYYKEIAAATAAGFFNKADNFNPTNNFTRGQSASVIVRAYDLEGDTTSPFKDLAGSGHEDAIGIMYNLGLAKGIGDSFNPNNNVTREQFAMLLHRTIDAQGGEVGAVAPAVTSVKAINSKTIEVTFNRAVDFTADNFTVSKGTVKSNVANVTLSKDKKSAQIELTSKLTKGDYTVTVKQADKDTLTATASVDDERVSALNILSDIAPLGSDKATATVGANVNNQYGEDITKLNSTAVTVTVSGAATGGTLNTDGTLTLTGINSSAVKEGDKVVVTLIHAATATTTTKTITLSSASIASEASIGSLYNADGKTLTQDSDVTADKFYTPITVKDQYGKGITDAAKVNSELIITNTNPAVATFADKVQKVTINGEDVLALEVTGVGISGQTNVLAISKANGTSAQGTVTVAEGVRINSTALSAPTDLVTANKDALFPLTVTDNAGNEVRTLKALNAINDKITVTGVNGGTIVEVAGKGLFVKVPAANVSVNSPLTVMVNTSTGKVSTQTVVPKAEAVAAVVTGISKDVDTAIRENGSLTIGKTDLVVEDQYGQVISKDALGKLTLAVAGSDALAVTPNADGTYTIKPVAGTTKASDRITFKLVNNGTAVESSTFTKTFSIVKDADLASFQVQDVDPIYVQTNGTNYSVVPGYDKDIVVKGTSKSGSVVTLTRGTDYTVTGLNPNVTFATGSDTAKQTVTITINSTGEQLTKEITYSKAAATPVKVELAPNGISETATKYDVVSSLEVNTPVDASTLEGLVNIIVTDQYGVKKVVDVEKVGETGIDTLTFTKVSGNVTFSKNGTSTAKVVNADKDAVVNATVNVGGQKATVQLIFTQKI
jgi:hypothetical protein